METSKVRRVAWIVGAWLSAHAALIAGHVLVVFVYSMLVAPGLTNADYQAFAMASGPWFSIVAGGPVFYLWARVLAKRFPDAARSTGIIVLALYAATDFAVATAVQGSPSGLFIMQWIASQTIKLVAVLWATRGLAQAKA